MKINVDPDKEKAKSLRETANITIDRLNELDKEKYPSNTLTDYYEAIRKHMEALTSIEGVKFKGESAHYDIINHVFNKYSLSESDRQFVQEMRDYRNRISYEGFSVRKEYIAANLNKINSVIDSLSRLVDDKLYPKENLHGNNKE